MREVFDINEFYRWAQFIYSKEKFATHPLNWMTLAVHSNMFDSIDKSLLTGVKPMIEAAKEMLVGKKYKYVVAPNAFKKLKHKPKMLEWDKKNLCPIYKGKLEFKGNDFILTGFEKTKIAIKYAWILEEIK